MTEAEHRGRPPAQDVFAEYRSLLFTVAYEITSSAADAEDVVQDAYLRWHQIDQDTVDNPRAYLVKISTRQALNKLRTTSRRRETYVGPWLPEPLLTTADIADDVVLAEAVCTAMLVVLDTLGPTERAVFVLHEVFGLSHPEIAEAIGKTPAAVRQIAHRSRSHVQARRPRKDRSDAQERIKVLTRFQQAMESGDLQALMDVMAPDVVLISDGGGVRSAALRPIVGPDKAARFLLAVTEKLTGLRFGPAMVNGELGTLAYVDDVIDSVGSVDIVDGRVTALYLSRNPAKLTGLTGPHPLHR